MQKNRGQIKQEKLFKIEYVQRLEGNVMKQINFSRGNDFIQLLVDVTETILSQYSIYMPPPEKDQGTRGFLAFSGCVEMEHRLKMG